MWNVWDTEVTSIMFHHTIWGPYHE
jgi:hypothetical protein